MSWRRAEALWLQQITSTVECGHSGTERGTGRFTRPVLYPTGRLAAKRRRNVYSHETFPVRLPARGFHCLLRFCHVRIMGGSSLSSVYMNMNIIYVYMCVCVCVCVCVCICVGLYMHACMYVIIRRRLYIYHIYIYIYIYIYIHIYLFRQNTYLQNK